MTPKSILVITESFPVITGEGLGVTGNLPVVIGKPPVITKELPVVTGLLGGSLCPLAGFILFDRAAVESSLQA